jgi:DNA repair photolyase
LRLPYAIGQALREKERAREELETELTGAEISRARKDHHSKRKPRPCGITVHTGVGCSYRCVYCYIWDMGFPGKPKPYPLSPRELALALAINPYVVPGHTFAAYGSVTEPFLPETREQAVEYIREVYRRLRLPSQVSTKSVIDEDLASKLREAEPRLSVLVSVSIIGEEAGKLEPGAPPPEERLMGAGVAIRNGLSVALFMRPIIPGVTDRQARAILGMALNVGIRDVVLGSLRVTPRILEVLSRLGIYIPPSVLPRMPRNRRDQVTIRAPHLKKSIAELALSLGMRVYPTACSHNVHSHRIPCSRCKYGPCFSSPPLPTIEEVEEALELLNANRYYRIRSVSVSGIILDGPRPRGKGEIALYWLREVSGLMVRGRGWIV